MNPSQKKKILSLIYAIFRLIFRTVPPIRIIMNEVTASFCVLIAAAGAGLWSTLISYLENHGLTWVEMFFFSQVTILICNCFLWLAIFSYRYYFGNIGTDEFLYDAIPSHDGVNDMENDKKDVEAGMKPTRKINFVSYIFSIFPSISTTTRKEWTTLILRGVAVSGEIVFYMIALMYIQSGDGMVLRTTFSSFFGIFFGVLLFGEVLTIVIVVCLVVSVGGLILVCQPEFIFSNENSSDEISGIGIVFVLLSATCRTGDRILMRYSGDINVHWLTMLIIPYSVGVIWGIIQLVCMILIDGTSNMSDVWYNWSPTSGQDYGLTLGVAFYGILVTCNEFFFIIGYQNGNVGILGLITNFDIPVSYLLEIAILNVVDNGYVYLGAVIVVIAIVIIFWEQNRLSSNDDDENVAIDRQATECE